jgi:hypothetical protein
MAALRTVNRALLSMPLAGDSARIAGSAVTRAAGGTMADNGRDHSQVRKGGQVDQAFPGLLLGLPPAGPGRPRPPLAAGDWAALIAHVQTRARYEARVHQQGDGDCWYWLGAISDTGHGKLRAGSRAAGAAAAGEPPSRVVTSHVLGYRMTFGEPGTALIAHRCDEASCHNPAHWRPADVASNTAEYAARRHAGPLADQRGPAGRARAIAAAIRTALRAGASPAAVDAAIAEASAFGMPLALF